MTSFNKKGLLLLVLGDIACFILALLTTFFVRYRGFDTGIASAVHISTWGVLFVTSLVSFFIAGLYEKHTLLFEHRLPGLLFKAQLGNALIAIACFYFLPLFNASPRTLLFLYLIFSSAFISLWRLYGRKLFLPTSRSRAVVVGSGKELVELISEINNNPRYPFEFIASLDVASISQSEVPIKVLEMLKKSGVTLAIIDFELPVLHGAMNHFSDFMQPEVTLVDFSDFYEEIFDRVALQNLNASSFVEKSTSTSFVFYDSFKRFLDIFLSVFLGILTLVLLPSVFFSVKAEDRGSVFIPQIRIGRRGKNLSVYKFRTMEKNILRSGEWIPEGKNKVTKVGSILRRTSLDEFPQALSVLKGEMSLIGPRADIEGLYKRLSEEIPNYPLRTLIKPGISGWAQIQQIYKKGNISPQSVEETRLRLAYDLYYIKHRSVFIDIKIALRTATILLSRIFS